MFVQYLTEFSGCLSSMKLAQNLIIPLFAGLKRKGDVASGMDSAVRQVGSFGLPKAFTEAVLDYWTRFGIHIKAYRDVDQHFSALVGHTYVELRPSQRVVVVLPDNPESKSRKKFTFQKNIVARAFCEDAYRGLDEVVGKSAAAFELTPTPIQQSASLAPVGALAEGEHSTIGVLFHGDQSIDGIALGQTPDRRAWVKELKNP
jgi:hypothetical protein